MKPRLTEADFKRAANICGCSVAAIKAVAEVESRDAGFFSDGQPVILFERHIFSRLTNGAFDKTHPKISNKTPGGYGNLSSQHSRLAEATALNREAALQSASWGKFQVMGFNWQIAGYASLQKFINAMYRGEGDHLDAFIGFVRHNKLDVHLRNKNWKAFARGYNGPAYAQNKYDQKLSAAYTKFGGS